jgi:hypothetical protein
VQGLQAVLRSRQPPTVHGSDEVRVDAASADRITAQPVRRISRLVRGSSKSAKADGAIRHSDGWLHGGLR